MKSETNISSIPEIGKEFHTLVRKTLLGIMWKIFSMEMDHLFCGKENDAVGQV